MKNQRVAAVFREFAHLLELREERPFRVKAYRRAAQVIEGLPEGIEAVAQRGELQKLPGIGKDLAGKIREVLDRGTFSAYEEIQGQVHPALVAFLSLPGLTPRLARYLFERLGIRSLDDLERMARTHMLRTLPEIDKEAEDAILEGIESLRKAGQAHGLPI